MAMQEMKIVNPEQYIQKHLEAAAGYLKMYADSLTDYRHRDAIQIMRNLRNKLNYHFIEAAEAYNAGKKEEYKFKIN